MKKYKIMKITVLFLFIMSLNVCSYGQTKSVAVINSKKQGKIDHSKPSVYIDFEKIGKGDPLYASDSKERVWLKLVNNSIWSIYVGIFVYGTDEKIGLYHYVEKEKDSSSETEVPQGYKKGDVSSPDAELKSGKSISFNVPQNHLNDNLKIRVDFIYEWEMNIDSDNSLYSNPKYSVFFSSSDLKKFLSK